MTSRLNGENGLTREGLADRIAYCARELDYLRAVTPNCTTCWHYQKPRCAVFAQDVPPEFAAVGCEQWEFNDVPF